MKTAKCFVSTVAALLVLAAGVWFAGPATASQGVDPCYKLCYMSGKYPSKAEKQDCSTRCRASDRYKCDTKCIKTIGNPQKQYECRKKCVGLPGGW
jgi:hypothetical protein